MQVSASRLALVGWLCDASMFYSNVERSRVIMLSYQRQALHFANESAAAISIFATKYKSPIVTSQWGQCRVRGPRQQPSKSLSQRQVCRRTTRDYGVRCLTSLEARTGVSTNNTCVYMLVCFDGSPHQEIMGATHVLDLLINL